MVSIYPFGFAQIHIKEGWGGQVLVIRKVSRTFPDNHFFDLRIQTFADIGKYRVFRLTNLRISKFIRNYMQSANMFLGSPMLAKQRCFQEILSKLGAVQSHLNFLFCGLGAVTMATPFKWAGPQELVVVLNQSTPTQ